MIFINVDEYLTGSIDMHLHPGITKGPARVDVIEAAEQARQAGMKALVYKSHSYTAAVATLVDRVIPDIKIFGSICLNYEVGGVNAHAVENAVMFGAKVVWRPTFSSANSINMMRALGFLAKGEGLSILDDKGNLVPDIAPILKLIKENNLVLATGHISPEEVFTLVEETRKIGVNKIIITHPTDKEFMEKVLTLEEMQQLANTGAFLEFTIIGILPNEFCHHPADRLKVIKAVGAEHCIISTDLGQPQNPIPAERMRLFIATLLHHGINPEEVELMVKKILQHYWTWTKIQPTMGNRRSKSEHRKTMV